MQTLFRALAVAGLWTLAAGAAFADDAAEKYYEQILTAEPVKAGAKADAKDGSNRPPQIQEQTDCITCDYDPFGDAPYYLRARGGMSYHDNIYGIVSDSKVGGAYGLDLAVPLVGDLGAFASGNINHFSGGSQYLGVVGFYKLGEVGDWLDRLGWLVLFDQFTDTRFDDLYLTQFRYAVSWTIDEKSAVGVSYHDPITRDRVTRTPTLRIPGGSSVSTSQVVQAWYSTDWNGLALSASLSYRDVLSTVGYGLQASRPVNDRVSVVGNILYEDAGLWTGFMGVEVALGPQRQSCGCTGRAPATGDTVRGALILGSMALGQGPDPFKKKAFFPELRYGANNFAERVDSIQPLFGNGGGVVGTVCPNCGAGAVALPDGRCQSTATGFIFNCPGTT